MMSDTEATCNRPSRRVAVLGNDWSLRMTLRSVLEPNGSRPTFVTTPEQCLAELWKDRYDLLIIDVNGEFGPGSAWLSESTDLFPWVRILALIDCGCIAAAVAMMRAGATECLEKPVDACRLSSIVTSILRARHPLCRPPYEVLTRTEVQVLSLILAGEKNSRIAYRLYRSTRTVEVHRRHIMQKLGVHTLRELVMQAVGTGLLRLRADCSRKR